MSARGELGGPVRRPVVWLGESAHSLDEKGRVFVARRFQAGLDRDAEGRLTAVLTRGFEGCLFLFSESGFEGILRRLHTQAFAGAQERRMQRLFFANSHWSALDASGRLLIPEKLRAHAGLERDVVLVGVIDRIEVWSKAAWEAFEAKNAGEFDRLDRVLLSADGAPVAGT